MGNLLFALMLIGAVLTIGTWALQGAAAFFG
jgi:hypothetical protein